MYMYYLKTFLQVIRVIAVLIFMALFIVIYIVKKSRWISLSQKQMHLVSLNFIHFTLCATYFLCFNFVLVVSCYNVPIVCIRSLVLIALMLLYMW